MKKLLILLGALSVSAVAYGQGQITFNNVSATTSRILLTSTTGPNNAASGVGSGFTVELLAGSSASSLSSVFSTKTAWQGAAGSAASGYFDAGTVTLAGIAGGSTASFQVRVFDGAAYGTSTTFGQSAIFSGPVGGPAPAPPSGFPVFTGFTLVPEPSTMALGLLAGAGLLALRRRKA